MEQNEAEMNLPQNSEKPNPEISGSYLRSYFSKPAKGKITADEKEIYFYSWYNHGRLSATKFHEFLVREFPDKVVPSAVVLDNWMPEYRHRAMMLDSAAAEQIEAAVIAEKVEMLKRHAIVGTKMQDVANDYIEAHKGEMSMPAAIRMLIEGVRIERESRGIPQALEKMLTMTDEELLDKVKQLMTSSASVKLEGIDESS